jgi:hypothetical protein
MGSHPRACLGENVPKSGFEILETEMLQHAFTATSRNVGSQRRVCEEERDAVRELCDVSVRHEETCNPFFNNIGNPAVIPTDDRLSESHRLEKD